MLRFVLMTSSPKLIEMTMETWIGLAHVRPHEGNSLLQGGDGAFVPVVGLASDADELANFAATLLHHHEFEVVDVDDIELLSERLANHSVEDEILEVANKLDQHDRIGVGKFQIYSE